MKVYLIHNNSVNIEEIKMQVADVNNRCRKSIYLLLIKCENILECIH